MDDFRHPEYSEPLLDHFRNPRNVGTISSPDAHAFVESPLHGDTLRLTFTLSGDRIRRVLFQCRGCTVAIAAGSAATTLLEGRTITEALLVTNDDVERVLGGVPENRKGCSLLVAEAVRVAFAAGPFGRGA